MDKKKINKKKILVLVSVLFYSSITAGFFSDWRGFYYLLMSGLLLVVITVNYCAGRAVGEMSNVNKKHDFLGLSFIPLLCLFGPISAHLLSSEPAIDDGLIICASLILSIPFAIGYYISRFAIKRKSKTNR